MIRSDQIIAGCVSRLQRHATLQRLASALHVYWARLCQSNFLGRTFHGPDRARSRTLSQASEEVSHLVSPERCEAIRGRREITRMGKSCPDWSGSVDFPMQGLGRMQSCSRRHWQAAKLAALQVPAGDTDGGGDPLHILLDVHGCRRLLDSGHGCSRMFCPCSHIDFISIY
jgi:hypothetical protein